MIKKILLLPFAACISYLCAEWYRVEFWELNVAVTLIFGADLIFYGPHKADGYGVTKERCLAGVPLGLFLFHFLPVFALALFMFAIDSAQHTEEEVAHTYALGTAVLLGWAAGLISWYAFSAQERFYHNEKYVRRMLRMTGATDEQIELIIAKYRDEGMFGTKQ